MSLPLTYLETVFFFSFGSSVVSTQQSLYTDGILQCCLFFKNFSFRMK